MLKWAVGHHHRPGSEHQPCCPTRPPFKKIRRRSTGKENESQNVTSPRTRDSVYMRLECVPAALRDLSNHRTSPTAERERTHQRSQQDAIDIRSKRPRPYVSPKKGEGVGRFSPKKQPCVEEHRLGCSILTGSSYSLDSARSVFEFTPSKIQSPGAESFYFNRSPSPIQLDHKEIPLEPEAKELILATPRPQRPTGVTPLARRMAELKVNRPSNQSTLSPAVLTTTATIPMPLLHVPAESEALRRWVAANRRLEATPIQRPPVPTSSPSAPSENSAATFIVHDLPTNHDRDDSSAGRTARKRRGVIFDEGAFSLDTTPLAGALKRQRVVRRRIRQHPISSLSENCPLLGLTIPGGIPSPPSPDSPRGQIVNPRPSSISSAGDDAQNSIGWSGESPELAARTRRCLAFSPRPRSPGDLEISISHQSGVLTIYVIRGRNLHASNGSCNPYVKVSLAPSMAERTYHRTNVRRDTANPKFDQKFSFELLPEDMEKQVHISAWHRDRSNRKSEFLGCLNFSVKSCINKEVQGWYRLTWQSRGLPLSVEHAAPLTNHQQPDVMANHSESSIEELISVDESDVPPTPDAGGKERKRLSSSKKDYGKVIEDYIFLRYLELDPPDETGTKRGRTPFTTTRRLKRHPGTSYGFSIAWTHPPRIERVESGLPADQAGLRPGDYIIFVDKSNVVTMKEEEILEIIKMCGNELVMESYRKAGGGAGRVAQRPPTACSAATTTVSATDATKRRLHLPPVAFSSEPGK